jgi:hypothetical protein
MRKGNQVKLIGKYPFCGNDGIVKYSWETIYRHVTAEEVQEWRDSPESRGIDDAGESRLRPTCTSVSYEGGTLNQSDFKTEEAMKSKLSEDTFTVVRARCAPRLSYGRKWAGMTLVRNDRTGEAGYIKRTEIQLITCNTK